VHLAWLQNFNAVASNAVQVYLNARQTIPQGAIDGKGNVMKISGNTPKFGLALHITGGIGDKNKALQALKGNQVKVNYVKDDVDDAFVATGGSSPEELKNRGRIVAIKGESLANMLWQDPKTTPEELATKNLWLNLLNA
jgi:hypothetical protein